MPITFTHFDVAVPRHGRDDSTRIERQDLVVVTMEQQKRSTAQSRRHFASRRLGREGNDAGHFVHHHRHTDGYRTAERVAHHHHALRT